MLTQAEEGMKLFEAQQGTAAEVDKAAAEKYKVDVDARSWCSLHIMVMHRNEQWDFSKGLAPRWATHAPQAASLKIDSHVPARMAACAMDASHMMR